MRPPPLDLIKAYITRYDIMAFYCLRNENIVISDSLCVFLYILNCVLNGSSKSKT